MSTRIGKLLFAALLGTGLAVSPPVVADVDLIFGIYAADKRVAKMWQCGGSSFRRASSWSPSEAEPERSAPRPPAGSRRIRAGWGRRRTPVASRTGAASGVRDSVGGWADTSGR